ncbi:MAG: hypothetical protein HKO57_06280 [Akkermansiaceae bacterium]|nr:hypothetical protein [Akkermansiaceae bacterium]
MPHIHATRMNRLPPILAACSLPFANAFCTNSICSRGRRALEADEELLEGAEPEADDQ